MQVVVYSTLLKQKDIPIVQKLFDVLHDLGINVYIYTPYLTALSGHIVFKKDVAHFDSHLDFLKRKIDFVITLGGDGTILNALTLIRNSEIPVLGINLGRLGFLASIEKKRVHEAIEALHAGQYTMEERSLLQLESNLPIFDDAPFALNDCTLLKRDTSSMITIHTFINGAFLNSYWADGIIIATPTGSTGYSLSCGGPIIFPNSSNFVITPVAPHNLNVRPVVISDNAVISFEIEGRSDNFLCTLDSRFETVTTEHRLAVRRCNFSLRIVQLQGLNFLNTIREKLSWGKDVRNY